MTKVLILGGGGMIGQKLAALLIANGRPAADITLHDIAFPPAGVTGTKNIASDIADPATAPTLSALRPDVIFHLASIVSGEAEKDFDKGWNVNLHSMMYLLAALRIANEESCGSYLPRVVFTSSIAVFGGPYPDVITDDYLQSPQTSYGAQKLMCETLLQDYSRKGFVDGISLRLPTICVRPGKPNLAASSFFSGIIREPLNGQNTILPVPDTTRHWLASPRAAVGFLAHAATLNTDQMCGHRALNMPGVSCSVAEQIDSLRNIAGQSVVDLIKSEPDPDIARIVAGWPRNFDAQRATDLGFNAESSFDEIIQTYIRDDLQNP